MDIIKKINESQSIWEIISELNVKQLENVIKLASDSYYNSDVSLISDEDYDALVERLNKIDPNSKVLKETGAPIKGKKVKLPYWMGSMDKIKGDEKIITKWTNKYNGPYLISDKLDGISCLLTMTDGESKLYTRGDGSMGQDITHLIGMINIDIEKLYNLKMDTIAIRGELIMTKKNFEKYTKIMSNARNMVAGIVNSKISSINKKHATDVDFVVYEIIEPIELPSNQLQICKKWGLNTVYYDIYEYIDVQILDSILVKRKKRSIYEIDGIIVTDDHKHTRNKSGNPPYSFAYKGTTETADVKVIDVIWDPSKDGILVPTVHYEKVRLSQANLEYATGFNAKFIMDNGIGPGAIITIIRSGDVIPYIKMVVKSSKISGLPNEYSYKWDNSGVNIVLKNADQNEKVIIKRLTKFIRYIGVENMSEGIVTKLVYAGYNTVKKLINITVNDMLEIEGFGKRLAEKIYNNLQQSLDNLNLLTLMAASNIFGRGFGERKLKKIMDVYPNIVKDYSINIHDKWYKKLMNLEGFDVITADQFLNSLPIFQKFYYKINSIVKIKSYVPQTTHSGLFVGQNVVFTGFRNKDWQKIIENQGGKNSGSVSKNTTLLVYNDGEESSAKYQKAVQLGINVMSKSQFSKKYHLE